jgi:hypothetical protein
MVINSSLSAANLQNDQLSHPKPVTQPANASAVSSTPAPALSSSAETLAASASEITSDDAAQQSLEFARNSILNQPSLALLAQGRHQPQTVMDLLAQ